MRPVLQLMNKVNQLGAQQRRDILTLLEILRGQDCSEREVIHILPRQFPAGYLDVWAQALGGRVKELSRFFRGSTSHVSLLRASLLNLQSDSSVLIFAVLFYQDVWLDELVQTDVMETFYVTQGHLELTSCLTSDDLRFQLGAGDASQVYPGKPYRLFAELGTQVIVVHQLLPALSEWGIWMGEEELTGLQPPSRVKRRKIHEGGRSGTA